MKVKVLQKAKTARECMKAREHACKVTGGCLLILGTFLGVYVGMHGLAGVVEITGLAMIALVD